MIGVHALIKNVALKLWVKEKRLLLALIKDHQMLFVYDIYVQLKFMFFLSNSGDVFV